MDEYHKDKVAKLRNPADIDSHLLNPITKKLLREEFAHGYQKINKHSEGRCYGCAFNDRVSAITVNVCLSCIGRRGDYRDSSLITFICDKPELFCDFCGKWKYGGAHINVRICRRCSLKLNQNSKSYIEKGGQMSNPFYRHLMKQHGKDWRWQELFGEGKWKK